MTTYPFQIAGTRLFVPLDLYAIGVYIARISDDEFTVEQIRKVAGEQVGVALANLPSHFISLRSLVSAVAVGLTKGVAEKDRIITFRLKRGVNGFHALPSAALALSRFTE